MGDALLQECGQQCAQMIGHDQQGSNDTNQPSSPMKATLNQQPWFGRWLVQLWWKNAQPQLKNAPSQEDSQPFHTCYRKLLFFPTTDHEIFLRRISLNLNANYLQMKSLDGFFDLQLGRYCFNLETEFSLQGFRNPRLKLTSFLQNNFLKMINQ